MNEFSADQQRVLNHVLDEIIPPSDDGRLPGAGELGLATHVDDATRATPEMRAMIVDGIAALDRFATRRAGQGFAALSRDDRLHVLNEHASSEHSFPPMLIMYAYTGYYQHPRVLTALGLEPRPPHPKGYEMAPDDFSLLDPVRQRRPFYRQPAR
jgi:hypothetical protein